MWLSRRKAMLLAAAAITLPRSSSAFIHGGVNGFNWSSVDGSPGASPGTAQRPTYFTGYLGPTYAHRPPWSVAGVDYRIGPRGTLTDYATWFATSPAGVTFAGAGQGFTYGAASSGLVVQSVDFTGDSGSAAETYNIISSACNGITFIDCKFRQKPWASGADWLTCLQVNGTGTIQFKYCEIDGNGFNVATNVSGYASDLQVQGASIQLTLLYCWLHSAGSQNAAWQNVSAGTSNYLAKYCLFEDAGLCSGPGNTGVHGDWIYTDGFTGDHIPSMSVQFCTFDQQFYSGRSNANTQGIAYVINAEAPIYDALNVSNSTFAIASGALVNQYVIYSYQELGGNITITQNYVDSQFLGSAPQWISNDVSLGSQNGTRILSGNIDMVGGGLADYGAYVSGSHTGSG